MAPKSEVSENIVDEINHKNTKNYLNSKQHKVEIVCSNVIGMIVLHILRL
jgi:hypothetical protein